jgi:hypothetical protein
MWYGAMTILCFFVGSVQILRSHGDICSVNKAQHLEQNFLSYEFFSAHAKGNLKGWLLKQRAVS